MQICLQCLSDLIYLKSWDNAQAFSTCNISDHSFWSVNTVHLQPDCRSNNLDLGYFHCHCLAGVNQLSKPMYVPIRDHCG